MPYSILVEHVPVEVHDLFTWARCFEHAHCTVDSTPVGDVGIRTVFVGLDPWGSADSPPLLFETLVFGGRLDQEQRRYVTWDEAVAGHAEMVARVQHAQEGTP